VPVDWIRQVATLVLSTSATPVEDKLKSMPTMLI
jgi:hypothetical protein